MNSFKWWQNVLGELISVVAVMGITMLLGWIKDQPVPMWATYLAAMIGVILWTRPRYDRKQDFDK